MAALVKCKAKYRRIRNPVQKFLAVIQNDIVERVSFCTIVQYVKGVCVTENDKYIYHMCFDEQGVQKSEVCLTKVLDTLIQHCRLSEERATCFIDFMHEFDPYFLESLLDERLEGSRICLQAPSVSLFPKVIKKLGENAQEIMCVAVTTTTELYKNMGKIFDTWFVDEQLSRIQYEDFQKSCLKSSEPSTLRDQIFNFMTDPTVTDQDRTYRQLVVAAWNPHLFGMEDLQYKQVLMTVKCLKVRI